MVTPCEDMGLNGRPCDEQRGRLDPVVESKSGQLEGTTGGI
jgi:hypothetical protein